MYQSQQTISAQSKFLEKKGLNNQEFAMPVIDTVVMFSDTGKIAMYHPDYVLLKIIVNSCKSRLFVYGVPQKMVHVTGYSTKENIYEKAPLAGGPFLRVHGSIMYEGYYQSNLDTPYIQKNVFQHTLQAGLDITVKNKYPIRLFFTTRFGNASFLRNITDLNLQFNNNGFRNKINENLEKWGKQQLAGDSDLNRLDSMLTTKRKEIDSLRGWLSNSAVLQKLVEEKEKKWLSAKLKQYALSDSAANGADSLTIDQLNQLKNWRKGQRQFDVNKTFAFIRRKPKWLSNNENDSTINAASHERDSSVSSIQKKYATRRARLDSLVQKADSLQKLFLAEKKRVSGAKDSLINHLTHIKDPGELAYALKNLHLPDSVLPAGYKHLLAFRSFGVGRNTVNYSELSLKNVSVQGVQAEYNPSYYLAVAAGIVDYRFRDFVVNEHTSPRQYVVAIRGGTGMKEGNHLFVTWYTGKKQVYNYGTDSVGGNAPDYNLMGITLEKRWQLGQNTYVVGEAAKSSLPYYSVGQNKQSLLASTFSLRERSNEAYSIKLATVISPTQTRIAAYYKKLGANFQSFSTFTSSSAQEVWSIKVDQPFFKKKLIVSGSVKKNDFTNPYINQPFYSNTVFKSIMATLRMKKWPIISVGYYPSSQLTKLGDNRFTENLFYTFVGTATHFYKVHSMQMNSVISYTQFYNKAPDSGFVYYNTKNILLGQSLFLKKMSIQANISAAENGAYNIYSADGSVQIKMQKWLTVGGGLKYISQTVTENKQVGYSANATIHLSRLGEIQFMLQKAYIPGANKQLVENDIGRLMYTKTF
jgi:hypothetical protein